MNSVGLIFRIVLAWIALLAAQMVAGMVIRVNSPAVPHVMQWLMVSDALIALALGVAALRSDWRDWRLARALFLIPAAITTVNMIEGVFFLTNSHIDWRNTIALTVAGYLIASILWWMIFRGAPVANAAGFELPHRSIGQMAGRFVLCAVCYLFLYYLAGMIIFPYVRDFYATQTIPPASQIIPMQLLLRGPVFILVCLTLLRMFRMTGVAGALAVGLAFTVLSGVATLIIPNPYFPDHVRWAHFCEVTSSNFAFGCVVAWVWGKAVRVTHLKEAHA